MEKEKPEELLNKYLKGTCTPSEKELVESWINSRLISSKWQWKDEKHKQDVKARIQQHLEKVNVPQKVSSQSYVHRFLWAASLALFIAVGVLLYTQSPTSEVVVANDPATEFVKPGTKSATLTLEDGSIIRLDDKINGILAKRQEVTIRKLKDGQLIYEAGKGKAEKPFMNKINIPLGGQYQITLPDGTQVWLNSASSLTYPSYFSGEERLVQLTGEAYFEVAKNAGMPFRVTAGDTDIKVTGTHFNVSAYAEDQRISTTLLEGSVDVVKNSSILHLKPGQRAVSIPQSDYFVRHVVDAEAAIGWKNGYFVFEDQSIETIMRDVARWYNVDVSFERRKGIEKKVGGTFSRSKSLDELLDFLEKLEVAQFKKEGRKIIVMI